MKRGVTETSTPGSTGNDELFLREPKRAPPPELLRKFWVTGLPLEGLGTGTASFEVPANAIVDDIKEAISVRMSQSQFYLSRRVFRLSLNGQHQPFFAKVDTIRMDMTLTFEWADAYPDKNQPGTASRP